MKKSHILILDDDQTLANALYQAVKRAGHEAYIARKPDEARPLIDSGKIDWLFVDCLLPQISGVDFVKSIRPTMNAETLAVVFMSGVYTDKRFIKDAMDRTAAIEFLQKPFDISKVIELVGSVDDGPTTEMSPRQELYGLLAQGKTTPRVKRKAIERVEQIHGFDLPYIYSLLVESQSSGHLNIAKEDGLVFGVSFSKGSIVAVDLQDKATYLGKLLIQNGYITSDELEVVLASNAPGRIGEKLINSNFVSPHAFQEMLAEQMNIRLSQTVVNEAIKVSFVVSDVELSTPRIDADDFLPFLHDWVASKITQNWLENHYRSWGNFTLKTRGQETIENPIFHMPLLKKMPQLVSMLSGNRSLQDILDRGASSDIDPELLYKALHLLFISGVIGFSTEVLEKDTKKQLQFLKKIETAIAGKNPFEIYEVMGGQNGVIGEEIEGVYKEFTRLIGPEPDASLEPELISLWNTVSKKANETYALLRDPEKREQCRQRIDQLKMEKKLSAERLFEEAHAALRTGQFQGALTTLADVEQIAPNREGLRLAIIWAKLGSYDSGKRTPGLLASVESDLLKVAPEDKHLPLYSYVQGLYYKCCGELGLARREFERAAATDPSFVEAKRELHLINLKTKKEKPKDLLNRDLKELVSSLFKRSS